MPAKDVYSIGREEAAEGLGVSTRTLDRWLKSGRVRSKVMNRIVYIHAADYAKEQKKADKKTRATRARSDTPAHAPDAHTGETVGPESRTSRADTGVYKTLYEEAAADLKQKQEKLEAAHFRVGQLETQLKNSVPLLEHTAVQESMAARTSTLEAENVKLSARAEREHLQMWMAVGIAGVFVMVATIFAVLLLLG